MMGNSLRLCRKTIEPRDILCMSGIFQPGEMYVALGILLWGYLWHLAQITRASFLQIARWCVGGTYKANRRSTGWKYRTTPKQVRHSVRQKYGIWMTRSRVRSEKRYVAKRTKQPFLNRKSILSLYMPK